MTFYIKTFFFLSIFLCATILTAQPSLDVDGTIEANQLNIGTTTYSGASITGASNLVINISTGGGAGVWSDDEFGPSQQRTMDLGSSGFSFRNLFVSGSVMTSDRRLKKNIQSINYGLEQIKALEAVTYNWKKGDNWKRIGFIAQDVEKVMPELVVHNPIDKAKAKKNGRILNRDDHDAYGIRYTELIPVLVKAIQEMVQENEALKARIEKLEKS